MIYNPKSKKRGWQLGEARNIIMAHRDPETPVGIVTGAKRENQEVRFVPLQALSEAPAGIQTTQFAGSRSSCRYLDMFTPRGYSGKYEIRSFFSKPFTAGGGPGKALPVRG